MDLQTAFYTLGIIVFAVFLVLLAVISFMIVNVYSRYKATRKKVERIKEAMPIVSYFFSFLNDRRKKNRN